MGQNEIFANENTESFPTYERGYFRSSGRGGFFSKKRRRNFSRSRMTLRVDAIEKDFFHWSKSREFHF